MSMSRHAISETVNRMRPGEALKVHAQELLDAYPGGFFDRGSSLQGAIDRFLSSCIGSAYGTVRCEADLLSPYVRISRHDEDGNADHCAFVYHVDPDRQWMFDRVPGGWQRRVEPEPSRVLGEAAQVLASGPGITTIP